MRNLLTLIILTLVIGFAVFQYGGVTPREWNAALIALCILALSLWLAGRASSFAPPPSPALLFLLAALPGYVALQLLPLPPGLLAAVSPSRYEIQRALVPSEGWAPLSLSPQLTFAQLLRLLAYVLVFLVTREIAFRASQRLWLAAIPLLVIGSFESAIGLIQHFESGGYATGTYVHHGHLAGLLEMVFPLTLVLIPIALRGGSGHSRFSLGRAALICILIGCAALILLGLLYTASRMSLAAAVVSVAVLGIAELRSRRNRSTAALITAVAGLTFLLLSAPIGLIGRYNESLTAEGRFRIWKDTLTLIEKYPVFGCGLGTFVSGIQRYLTTTPAGLVDYAHNDYLQLLAELGILGFVPAIALAAVFIRDILAGRRAEARPNARLLTTGYMASLAAIAVHSLVDFQFYIPANAMVASWIAGIAGGIAAQTKR